MCVLFGRGLEVSCVFILRGVRELYGYGFVNGCNLSIGSLYWLLKLISDCRKGVIEVWIVFFIDVGIGWDSFSFYRSYGS